MFDINTRAKKLFSAARMLFEKYERFLSPLAFAAGFLWDTITLTRVDLWLDHLALLAYLTVACIGIFIVNAFAAGNARLKFLEQYAAFLPIPIQFAFGGLFSGFFIFYSRSASIITSWPFLLLLAFLLVGNEFFRKRYARLVFHASILFIALFSYSIFTLPILIKRMDAWVFILSGLLSVAAIVLILLLLSLVTRRKLREHKAALMISLGGIYITFNFLYFTNIIPPIPLSLKEIGVYHSVIRQNDEYLLVAEPPEGLFALQNYSKTFSRFGNESVYVYSAVFAPTRLTTHILHRWSYFDESVDGWVTTDRIPFAIVGGRDGGYRGFSLKQNVTPGKWRVDVLTERDQVLGTVVFRITDTNAPPPLTTILR